MIGISGIARAGKDTLANYLKVVVEKELNRKVEVVHLADSLKSDLDKIVSCNFNFQVFTENNEEKELIRPILVAYGEAMKKKWGKSIWLKKLYEDLKKKQESENIFYIIADVRFDFEVEDLQKNSDAWVIHISKVGSEIPPNEVEKINDPKVREISDICHSWPPYEPDKMDLCMDHASILWEMIPAEKKEKWKI
jgi:hypothetical protein